MVDLSLHHDPARSTAGLEQRLLRRRFLHQYAAPGPALAAVRDLLARRADRARLLEVRLGGEPVGEVWVGSDGEERGVGDVALTDPALAAGVRERVEELARSEGAVRLNVAVPAGDDTAAAFVADAGYEVSATQMLLGLEEPQVGDAVVLAPMDQRTYAAWEADEQEKYAQERARTGESIEQARRIAREQHAEYLPAGLATEHHHFFVGRVDGERVGTMWIGTERPMAFVYDVEVAETHRRRGHGAGLMRAGARWSHEHGAHALGLNVFGHNRAARALYDRLGYRVTEEFVSRRLAP